MPRTPYMVRSHSPWWERIGALVLMCVLVGIGYLLFYTGQAKGRADYLTVQTRHDAVRGLNRHLHGEVARLRNELAAIERTYAINVDAYSEVKRAVRQLQGELTETREELSFYREIAITSDKGKALTIQNFRVMPLEREPGTYRYKLALSRVTKDDQVTRGKAALFVDGMQEGKAVR
ncbi:MAG: hypothetical protein HOI95_30325, partial [Chromatiales bacterium]|nr:hypothetical protein [Chromatiales bacterium]